MKRRMQTRRNWMVSGLVFALLTAIPACAVRNPMPDNTDPQADPSYRVELTNATGQTVYYNYTRYAPPRQPEILDPAAEARRSQTLDISFSFDELRPGATALLDVIPGTSLRLSYSSMGQEVKAVQKLDRPMQLRVSEQGIQSGK